MILTLESVVNIVKCVCVCVSLLFFPQLCHHGVRNDTPIRKKASFQTLMNLILQKQGNCFSCFFGGIVAAQNNLLLFQRWWSKLTREGCQQLPGGGWVFPCVECSVWSSPHVALHWRNSFFTGNWKSGCLPGALSHEQRMLLMARSTLLLIARGGNVFLCAENRLSGRKLTSYHILSASMSLSATENCTNPSFLFFPHWCCAWKHPCKNRNIFEESQWSLPLKISC